MLPYAENFSQFYFGPQKVSCSQPPTIFAMGIRNDSRKRFQMCYYFPALFLIILFRFDFSGRNGVQRIVK
jgi:hypothetical protein